MTMEQLRVAVVEDHPLFRKGVITLLGSTDGIQVIGEAATGLDAIALAAELQPDVLLMDLQMPVLGGIEATRAITRENPNVRVLILTLFDDEESVFMALRAGARGYILKDADEDDLVRAIRAIGRGEAIFSPHIAERVLSFFAAARPAVCSDVFPTLTDREREILHYIAQGSRNTEIARELSLSTKTVSNYVSNIFGKLQVADRAQAIIRAREAGLGQVQE
jgi:DNA-binding NarL/FixJ family response regulator